MPAATTTMGDIVTMTTSVDEQFWLAAAQKRVRTWCGWHIAPNADLDGVLDTAGGLVLRLPALLVTRLDSLTDEKTGGDLTNAVRYSPRGLLERLDGRPFAPGVARYRYRIHAGYEPDMVPDVQSVILQAARRAANTPAGIVKAQSVNGANVTYAMSGDGSPAIQLLEAEYRTLAPYRIGPLP